MIVRILLLGLVLSFAAPLMGLANTAPVVSSVQAVQREGSFLVDVSYDLDDAEGDACWVSLMFSPDGGATWPVLCTSVSGDIGAWVLPGAGRTVTWDARADFPGFIGAECTVKLVANDTPHFPYFEGFWRSNLDGSGEVALAPGVQDTIPYGVPFRLRWEGRAPTVEGLDPNLVAALDTVPPLDDGLLGFKYLFPDEPCTPQLDDCWQPRRFNEATGDSFSFFAGINSLAFYNDGSGPDIFRRLLPNGPLSLSVNAIDPWGNEVHEFLRDRTLVVNFDPETIMLDGETDPANPEDPEIYPYYILLNDPLQIHYPFSSGDTIPDRTYVVVKALGRDDPRDMRLDPSVPTGFTGYVVGTRDNLTGGQFSFATDASEIRTEPSWGPGVGGYEADTLGFLTGPRTHFEVFMLAVDEHGRRDGTPASLSFDVGYPPCIQCLEILPKSSQTSDYGNNVPCVDDPATHPCFQEVAQLRVSQYGVEPDDLEFVRPVFLAVDKATGRSQTVISPDGWDQTHYVIESGQYLMKVLLQGQDDPRESYDDLRNRIGGWRYQVDYDCDPYNLVKDGGGIDDINDFTWGEDADGSHLSIDPNTGLWVMIVDVTIPTQLFPMGPDNFRNVILPFINLVPPEDIDMVFDACVRQTGQGTVRAIALDQTHCAALPSRPAKYHYFRKVRPPVADLPAGMTWRDCYLSGQVPDIKGSLDLSAGAMEGHGGIPLVKSFNITVQTNTGDYSCSVAVTSRD